MYTMMRTNCHWVSRGHSSLAHVVASTASKKWPTLWQTQDARLFTSCSCPRWCRWWILLAISWLPLRAFVALSLVLVSSSLASHSTLPSSVATSISCPAFPTRLLTLHCNTSLQLYSCSCQKSEIWVSKIKIINPINWAGFYNTFPLLLHGSSSEGLCLKKRQRWDIKTEGTCLRPCDRPWWTSWHCCQNLVHVQSMATHSPSCSWRHHSRRLQCLSSPAGQRLWHTQQHEYNWTRLAAVTLLSNMIWLQFLMRFWCTIYSLFT